MTEMARLRIGMALNDDDVFSHVVPLSDGQTSCAKIFCRISLQVPNQAHTHRGLHLSRGISGQMAHRHCPIMPRIRIRGFSILYRTAR
jgi:hypothetical protein